MAEGAIIVGMTFYRCFPPEDHGSKSCSFVATLRVAALMCRTFIILNQYGNDDFEESVGD